MSIVLLQIVDLLEDGNCHIKVKHKVQGVVVKVNTIDQFGQLEESLPGKNVYASLVSFLGVYCNDIVLELI